MKSKIGAVIAVSRERYYGGIAVKRRWGSATITVFVVYRASDAGDATKWREIRAYGKTPGERKTFAMQEFQRLEEM